MIHCWCLPFQFPLNISVDKAAPTLCLEGDGRNNTFFSVLAYGTLNQIFSHSLQTPFPKGKTQQNPGSVHQLRQVIFLLAKCTQPAKWMSIFESFCENSKMRLASQKKGFWVGSISLFRSGKDSTEVFKASASACWALLWEQALPPKALPVLNEPPLLDTAVRELTKAQLVSASFKWQLHKLEMGCFIFQHHPGATFRGSFTDEFDEVQDELEAVGRNIRVRQVPRKAFQMCDSWQSEGHCFSSGQNPDWGD